MDDETTWGPVDPKAPVEPSEPPAPIQRRRAPVPLLAVGAAIVVSLGLLAWVLGTRGGDDGSEEVTSETSRGGPSPAALVAAAPGASRAAGTARIRSSMRSFEAGEAVKQVVEGGIDFGSGAYDLTFRLDGAGGPLGGSSGSDLDHRVFSDGTTIWSTIPPEMEMVPQILAGAKGSNPFKGKKYLAQKAGEGLTTSPSELDALGAQALGFSISSAPADVLTYLNGVGTAVKEGDEQLDGEQVARYGVDLDLDALQRALPSEERTFDAYDFKPDVSHSFPGKVWLDREGRLRRLTYRLDLAALLTDVALKADYTIEECDEPDPALVKRAEAGDKKAMATLFTTEPDCTERPARPEELVIEGSVELSEYGSPVSVTAPPATEVLTSEKLEAFFASQAAAALNVPVRPTRP